MAQFREVEDFTKLGFALDDATKRLVDRGTKLTRALIQNRFSPVIVPYQIVFLFASMNGFLDEVPADLVLNYETELYSFISKSIFHDPLSFSLRNTLHDRILTYVLTLFTNYFVNYYVR